jgi:hypothetical protein
MGGDRRSSQLLLCESSFLYQTLVATKEKKNSPKNVIRPATETYLRGLSIDLVSYLFIVMDLITPQTSLLEGFTLALLRFKQYEGWLYVAQQKHYGYGHVVRVSPISFSRPSLLLLLNASPSQRARINTDPT